MTTTGKVIVGIIVAIVVIGGGYYFYTMMQSASPAVTATSTAQAGQPMPTNTTVSQNSGTNPNALPSGSSTSDAALEQDSAAIDTQMNGLSSDNAAASQSASDQPVTQ